ncbi:MULTISPECIES: hypothetical protein [unclassified Streptomyces]|uniref:hypothetical protein n=1 Tax=unclassified Streptomyces TaxID=2593676 RepID=UPI001487EA7F|nr:MULTISPECIES: hypothetical protein [unclassified Streptomyces]
MPNGTQKPPERPSPTLPPSYAAQVLTVTARILDMQPDTIADGRRITAAYDIATDAILTPIPPKCVVQDSAARAEAAMPPYDGQLCGEYAARLRQIADTL